MTKLGKKGCTNYKSNPNSSKFHNYLTECIGVFKFITQTV